MAIIMVHRCETRQRVLGKESQGRKLGVGGWESLRMPQPYQSTSYSRHTANHRVVKFLAGAIQAEVSKFRLESQSVRDLDCGEPRKGQSCTKATRDFA